MPHKFDTVVIGGGPAGSTLASLLRIYDPEHRVLVLERETFPRDHIGESQLPIIAAVLDEMGVWDKVEAANFPIKIGATYRWGKTDDLWHFNFIPHGDLKEQARPAKFKGQRRATAFQVDRAIYDEILLDHAAGLGTEVRQGNKVVEVLTEGDRVTGLRLENGEIVKAEVYVDASGGGGLLRRAMGVEVDSPTSLRNIAIWDYFQNAQWAEEIGIGGTRIQVMSLGYGWIWFIPLGPTRTSVGLVVPAATYKEKGLKPEELLRNALQQEPRIRELMRDAVSENKLSTTNDWSFIADRLTGENWYLVGDACGFADPILSAGMTLAHAAGREVAYSILADKRGEHDPAWLKATYNANHKRRIGQHIRFADYWYSANAQFTDLKAYTSEIARDAGLDLDPDSAFQWLGTGGFVNDDRQWASIGTFSVAAVKQLTKLFSEDGNPTWAFAHQKELKLNLIGASRESFAVYENGKIRTEKALVRDGKRLPILGPYRTVVRVLELERDTKKVVAGLKRAASDDRDLLECLQALEAMLSEGWVKGKASAERVIDLSVEDDTPMMEYAT